jgi:hypothetical protein
MIGDRVGSVKLGRGLTSTRASIRILATNEPLRRGK